MFILMYLYACHVPKAPLVDGTASGYASLLPRQTNKTKVPCKVLSGPETDRSILVGAKLSLHEHASNRDGGTHASPDLSWFHLTSLSSPPVSGGILAVW